MTTDVDPTSLARQLDPQMVAVWRFKGVVWALVAALAVGAAEIVRANTVGGPLPGLAVLPVALAGGLFAWSWPPKMYEHWRYVVGDDALELRTGVVFRARKWIPYFRVQHIDIGRGPIDRRMGLARLVVRTASMSAGATLPGIPADEASSLRQLILDRTHDADDV